MSLQQTKWRIYKIHRTKENNTSQEKYKCVNYLNGWMLLNIYKVLLTVYIALHMLLKLMEVIWGTDKFYSAMLVFDEDAPLKSPSIKGDSSSLQVSSLVSEVGSMLDRVTHQENFSCSTIRILVRIDLQEFSGIHNTCLDSAAHKLNYSGPRWASLIEVIVIRWYCVCIRAISGWLLRWLLGILSFLRSPAQAMRHLNILHYKRGVELQVLTEEAQQLLIEGARCFLWYS